MNYRGCYTIDYFVDPLDNGDTVRLSISVELTRSGDVMEATIESADGQALDPEECEYWEAMATEIDPKFWENVGVSAIEYAQKWGA